MIPVHSWRRPNCVALVWALAAGVLTACAGTESDNPLVGTGSGTGAGTGTGTGTGTGSGTVGTEELVVVGGWVGGDASSTADDPGGIQGAWYARGDGQFCSVAATSNPCSAVGCCMTWSAAVDPTGDAAGCAVGLELNSTGGADPVRSTYVGSAIGFAIVLTGEPVPASVSLALTSAADPLAATAPRRTLSSTGAHGVLFADAVCPDGADPATCQSAAPGTSFALEVRIGATEAAASGTFCVTSLRLLY